ncbi:hypothetical protein [Flavimarina sp. Hel_I_48]|uniref:hypothetical protein n=1 Tax=Flavimarina sp. Hel_I_48 TaxID=1392488 RepID=UPI0004DF6FDD|nr:hypothetical protein [Flavimarina sp. Hel_I_48]
MIAYYAHQHGSGHSNCAQILANSDPENVLVLTSYPFVFSRGTQVYFLPSEDPDGSGAPSGSYDTPDYLHYSPVGQTSIQKRSATLLNVCLANSVELLIVDVSVEIAALCRAASIPYAYVRLLGKRSDTAHLQAFRGAVVLLAYYPMALEPEDTPLWIREKTIYLGFLSRFEQKTQYIKPKEIKNIVVLSGKGGNDKLLSLYPFIKNRFKESRLHFFNGCEVVHVEGNSTYHPHTSEIEDWINNADAVITSCGLNTISELLYLKKTILSVAEERPYDEQIIFQEQLEARGLVCSLEWALDKSDIDILGSTVDPSAYLNNNLLTAFLKLADDKSHIWDLKQIERFNHNGIFTYSTCS